MLRLVIICCCAGLLQSCVSLSASQTAAVKIEGLVIENQTMMWVSAAQLLVPATGRFISCGNIGPETSCATTFPETDFIGNAVQITWSQGGQIYSTGEFVMQVPDDIDLQKTALVRVVIAAPGSAGAAIVQSP